MEKYIKILHACPLFAEVSDGEIYKMLGCLGAHVQYFPKKSVVIDDGTPAVKLGILLSGVLQTQQLDCYGNRSILSEVRAGELFGEEFACAEVSEMPVSLVASEPCEVMLIDCRHILRTCPHNCAHHQQMIYNLMRNMAQKNVGYHERIEVTSKRTTREKLLAYLGLCAKRTGERSFEIPFNRSELADYLEVDRSGLSVEIGKLVRERVIACERKHFTIL